LVVEIVEGFLRGRK